jgi:hypothetical protein
MIRTVSSGNRYEEDVCNTGTISPGYRAQRFLEDSNGRPRRLCDFDVIVFRIRTLDKLANLLHRYLTNQLDVIMQICATGATGPSNCENATKFNRSIFGGDSAVDI